MDLPPVVSVDIQLPLQASENLAAQRRAIARKLRVPLPAVGAIRLRKHSIDARKKAIMVRLRFDVAQDGQIFPLPAREATLPEVPAQAPAVIVVGTGPAGIFAAIRLIELGLKPILVERGKDASARRFDLAPILRQGRVIEDSNYCFGEGGAGTFSDGKLYTRATKRGPVATIYDILVAHGAPDRIRIDARPHIGSNLLPRVIMSLRQSILNAGGEVHFQSKVTDLLLHDGQLVGVTTENGAEHRGQGLILATGHSARDIYQLLHRRGIRLEQKPFAVGVRIEHPQSFIDSQQYHHHPQEPRPALLPAASYRLATTIADRGVHSFCMCPGGFIVPAATANDEVVVNGMSLSRRDSPFANCGLVVTVEPEDTLPWQAKHGVLAGVAYQKALERRAKTSGGAGQIAPAQLVPDFLRNTPSKSLNKTSYFPGIVSAPLHQLLPVGIAGRMQQGLARFGQQMKGYTDDMGQLIGFETRTSSPVRIPRDPATLEHPQVASLFPCGEGAGYAGGIVSAALDGMKCAEAAAAKFGH